MKKVKIYLTASMLAATTCIYVPAYAKYGQNAPPQEVENAAGAGADSKSDNSDKPASPWWGLLVPMMFLGLAGKYKMHAISQHHLHSHKP